MKKTIKIILIIIFFICFLGLFLRPRSAFAENSVAYEAITTYRDFIQGAQNSVLSQFYTYGYLGLKDEWESGSVDEYRLNFTVDRIQHLSNGNYIIWTGSASYYYWSGDGFLTPRSFGGSGITIGQDNGVINRIYWSNWYYTSFPEGSTLNPKRTVTYCDLPESYYSDHSDGTSLVKHNLYTLPSSFNGVISSPSIGSTFGDNIQSAIDSVAPAPVVTTVPPTTLPPFYPPATLPPATLPPAETVTAFPALTDDSNNYYIDYSPYIDGRFYLPPATDDIALSPALSASGAIISEGFGWLTDSGVFSVLLVLMLVSFAIYNLI